MKSRRGFLAGCFVLLAGCSRITSSDDTETRTDLPEDYSLPDLEIYNKRDRPVATTVRFLPGENEDPTLELSVRVPGGEFIKWDDNPVLDDPGHITATIDDGADETRRDEYDWNGDTNADNRGIVVFVENDEIRIGEQVS